MTDTVRKIVHIDMDAFYASVEQRDDASLRGRPVVVAHRGARSVVCAASYEARVFGVRSAMPALRAERQCPDAVFVTPDFARYKAVSGQVRTIFARYTKLVEPLSLDEAYLDVTAYRALPTATATARDIRAAIRDETGLSASAGIAPNKYLAKIASDWRKPDGQFAVPPQRVAAFLHVLPVARIPGVGRVMQSRLAGLGVTTVGELRALEAHTLAERFGRWGQRLFELARGIDDRPVQPERAARQVSAEDTLREDLTLAELTPHIYRLAEKTWLQHARKQPRVAHTVVLKLKTADFTILTRSHTPSARPTSAREVADIACGLRRRVDLARATRYRLVGVGLAGFADGNSEPVQGSLL